MGRSMDVSLLHIICRKIIYRQRVTGVARLQMDTNFFVSSRTYLSLNQQSTNEVHPNQTVVFGIVDDQVIVHMRQSVMQRHHFSNLLISKTGISLEQERYLKKVNSIFLLMQTTYL